jgi:hypothetical protein
MAPVSISFDGVVRQSGRVAVIPAFSLDPLVCTLSASAKALRLQSADFDFPIAGFIPGKPITLHLVRSAKASGSFALLSILGREPRQASLNLEP